jgi:hypothetical protein
MVTTRAAVLTSRSARYGKQLVSHLSRRSEGEWSEAGTGWVAFGAGRLTLTTDEAALHLNLVADDPQDLARLEDVVGRHLVRFGTRDELRVTWEREDGTPGSEQVLADS